MVHGQTYPELQKYLTYRKQARDLDLKALLSQIQALQEQVTEKLTLNQEEKTYLEVQSLSQDWRKLFSFTMTPEDYQSYTTRSSKLSTTQALGFLNRKIKELGSHYERALFLEEGFEDILKIAQNFYDLTLKRDEVFVQNLTQKMTEANLSKSVLITGGYHTTNLKNLLKAKNISYVSITPQVLHETNLKRYEDVLLGDSFKTKPVVGQSMAVRMTDVLHAPDNTPFFNGSFKAAFAPRLNSEEMLPTIRGARLSGAASSEVPARNVGGARLAASTQTSSTWEVYDRAAMILTLSEAKLSAENYGKKDPAYVRLWGYGGRLLRWGIDGVPVTPLENMNISWVEQYLNLNFRENDYKIIWSKTDVTVSVTPKDIVAAIRARGAGARMAEAALSLKLDGVEIDASFLEGVATLSVTHLIKQLADQGKVAEDAVTGVYIDNPLSSDLRYFGRNFFDETIIQLASVRNIRVSTKALAGRAPTSQSDDAKLTAVLAEPATQVFDLLPTRNKSERTTATHIKSRLPKWWGPKDREMTIRDLVALNEEQILGVSRLGANAASALKNALDDFGTTRGVKLHFGMTLPSGAPVLRSSPQGSAGGRLAENFETRVGVDHLGTIVPRLDLVQSRNDLDLVIHNVMLYLEGQHSDRILDGVALLRGGVDESNPENLTTRLPWFSLKTSAAGKSPDFSAIKSLADYLIKGGAFGAESGYSISYATYDTSDRSVSGGVRHGAMVIVSTPGQGSAVGVMPQNLRSNSQRSGARLSNVASQRPDVLDEMLKAIQERYVSGWHLIDRTANVTFWSSLILGLGGIGYSLYAGSWPIAGFSGAGATGAMTLSYIFGKIEKHVPGFFLTTVQEYSELDQAYVDRPVIDNAAIQKASHVAIKVDQLNSFIYSKSMKRSLSQQLVDLGLPNGLDRVLDEYADSNTRMHIISGLAAFRGKLGDGSTQSKAAVAALDILLLSLMGVDLSDFEKQPKESYEGTLSRLSIVFQLLEQDAVDGLVTKILDLSQKPALEVKLAEQALAMAKRKSSVLKEHSGYQRTIEDAEASIRAREEVARELGDALEIDQLLRQSSEVPPVRDDDPKNLQSGARLAGEAVRLVLPTTTPKMSFFYQETGASYLKTLFDKKVLDKEKFYSLPVTNNTYDHYDSRPGRDFQVFKDRTTERFLSYNGQDLFIYQAAKPSYGRRRRGREEEAGAQPQGRWVLFSTEFPLSGDSRQGAFFVDASGALSFTAATAQQFSTSGYTEVVFDGSDLTRKGAPVLPSSPQESVGGRLAEVQYQGSDLFLNGKHLFRISQAFGEVPAIVEILKKENSLKGMTFEYEADNEILKIRHNGRQRNVSTAPLDAGALARAIYFVRTGGEGENLSHLGPVPDIRLRNAGDFLAVLDAPRTVTFSSTLSSTGISSWVLEKGIKNFYNDIAMGVSGGAANEVVISIAIPWSHPEADSHELPAPDEFTQRMAKLYLDAILSELRLRYGLDGKAEFSDGVMGENEFGLPDNRQFGSWVLRLSGARLSSSPEDILRAEELTTVRDQVGADVVVSKQSNGSTKVTAAISYDGWPEYVQPMELTYDLAATHPISWMADTAEQKKAIVRAILSAIDRHEDNILPLIKIRDGMGLQASLDFYVQKAVPVTDEDELDTVGARLASAKKGDIVVGSNFVFRVQEIDGSGVTVVQLFPVERGVMRKMQTLRNQIASGHQHINSGRSSQIGRGDYIVNPSQSQVVQVDSISGELAILNVFGPNMPTETISAEELNQLIGFGRLVSAGSGARLADALSILIRDPKSSLSSVAWNPTDRAQVDAAFKAKAWGPSAPTSEELNLLPAKVVIKTGTETIEIFELESAAHDWSRYVVLYRSPDNQAIVRSEYVWEQAQAATIHEALSEKGYGARLAEMKMSMAIEILQRQIEGLRGGDAPRVVQIDGRQGIILKFEGYQISIKVDNHGGWTLLHLAPKSPSPFAQEKILYGFRWNALDQSVSVRQKNDSDWRQIQNAMKQLNRKDSFTVNSDSILSLQLERSQVVGDRWQLAVYLDKPLYQQIHQYNGPSYYPDVNNPFKLYLRGGLGARLADSPESVSVRGFIQRGINEIDKKIREISPDATAQLVSGKGVNYAIAKALYHDKKSDLERALSHLENGQLLSEKGLVYDLEGFVPRSEVEKIVRNYNQSLNGARLADLNTQIAEAEARFNTPNAEELPLDGEDTFERTGLLSSLEDLRKQLAVEQAAVKALQEAQGFGVTAGQEGIGPSGARLTLSISLLERKERVTSIASYMVRVPAVGDEGARLSESTRRQALQAATLGFLAAVVPGLAAGVEKALPLQDVLSGEVTLYWLRGGAPVVRDSYGKYWTLDLDQEKAVRANSLLQKDLSRDSEIQPIIDKVRSGAITLTKEELAKLNGAYTVILDVDAVLPAGRQAFADLVKKQKSEAGENAHFVITSNDPVNQSLALRLAQEAGLKNVATDYNADLKKLTTVVLTSTDRQVVVRSQYSEARFVVLPKMVDVQSVEIVDFSTTVRYQRTLSGKDLDLSRGFYNRWQGYDLTPENYLRQVMGLGQYPIKSLGQLLAQSARMAYTMLRAIGQAA